MTLFLASQSPRRRDILIAAGVPFELIPNRLNHENLSSSLPVAEAVMALAVSKAQSSQPDRDGYVLGVDTVVVLDDAVLGKPADYTEAADMIRRLSGRTHRVITGFGLVGTGVFEGVLYAGCDEAWVTIKPLTDDQIHAYSHRDFVLDKAGGYAIQDQVDSIVSGCDGDPDTVVGLPLQKLLPVFRQFNLI